MSLSKHKERMIIKKEKKTKRQEGTLRTQRTKAYQVDYQKRSIQLVPITMGKRKIDKEEVETRFWKMRTKRGVKGTNYNEWRLCHDGKRSTICGQDLRKKLNPDNSPYSFAGKSIPQKKHARITR